MLQYISYLMTICSIAMWTGSLFYLSARSSSPQCHFDVIISSQFVVNLLRMGCYGFWHFRERRARGYGSKTFLVLQFILMVIISATIGSLLNEIWLQNTPIESLWKVQFVTFLLITMCCWLESMEKFGIAKLKYDVCQVEAHIVNISQNGGGGRGNDGDGDDPDVPRPPDYVPPVDRYQPIDGINVVDNAPDMHDV